MVEKAEHINVIAGGGLDLENIKEVMENTKAPQYHFGTAVRNDKSIFGEINTDRLRLLINTIRKQKQVTTLDCVVIGEDNQQTNTIKP